MAKFKKGDRVRNTDANYEAIPLGSIGTVLENDSIIPYVDWDNVGVKSQHEDSLELLTEPSSPTPEMGPVEGTMEYWRFLFAGQAMHGILSSGVYAIDDNGKYISNPKETSGSCVDAVQWADALIAELKKGGES